MKKLFESPPKKHWRGRRKKENPCKKTPKDIGEPSTASTFPQKRKASSNTSASSPSASSPILEKGITITTHSPLGQEWVEQLGGMVVHSTYMFNSTTRFKVTYHTSECYQALQDPEVIPHLDACNLGKMRFKFPCNLNMNYAVQFVKNYNMNTKQMKVISSDGHEKILTLSIDAVRNAFALDVVAEPYVDLRKLGNKLEGAANYESHKQRGVKFVDISPHLQKAARVLRLLIRVEPSNHHNIIPANHLLRLHKPVGQGVCTTQQRNSTSDVVDATLVPPGCMEARQKELWLCGQK